MAGRRAIWIQKNQQETTRFEMMVARSKGAVETGTRALGDMERTELMRYWDRKRGYRA